MVEEIRPIIRTIVMDTGKSDHTMQTPKRKEQEGNNRNNPDSFESIALAQIDLYRKKNSDYGSATDRLFRKHGFIYYQIMLEQKMQRIDSLIRKGTDHNFESLEDTLLDLSNYSILAVESLRKEKKEKEETAAID